MNRYLQIFAENFHKLAGNTIGERQRNFNLLLRDLEKESLNQEDLETLDQLLTPANLLENIFKLVVFIQLKYTRYLFKIFRNHNLYLIGKLMKTKWFFEKAFLDITGEVLVNEIFSGVSFITRLKIINKLAIHLQDSQLAEDYFEAIQNKYGLYQAKKLLPACTPNYVRSVMEKCDICFTDRELIKIVKKDHSFAEFYFKTNRRNVNDYQLVLKHLAIHDVELFLKLFDANEIRMKMNGKIIAQIYQRRKKNIIKEPLKYLPCLNVNKIIFLLNDDFDEFYKNCFPKDIDEFEAAYEKNDPKDFDCKGRLYILIQHLSPSKQYELLRKTFFQVYNTELLDCPEFINEQLLEIMQEPERDRWVEMKCKEDEKYVCYFNTCKAITLIKEKIKLTSNVTKRNTLLNYLVQTCAINKDESALLSILKYFEDRHRNEDANTISSFLDTIVNNFKMQRFSAEYWIVIRKIIEKIDLNGRYNNCIKECSIKYIHYLLLNGNSNSTSFLKALQELVTTTWSYNVLKPYPAMEKEVLLRIPEVIENAFKKEDLFDKYNTFMASIGNWNKRHRRDFINPYSFPKIIKTLLLQTHTLNWLGLSTIKTLSKVKSENDLKRLEDEKVWQKLNKLHFFHYLLDPLLRINPDSFVLHLEDILKSDKDMKSIWRKAKLYSHLQIPKNMIQYYKNQLRDDNNKHYVITALSILMPTSEYLELMSTKKDRLMQNTFIKHLVYVDNYSLTFPVLLKFCQDDFLQFAVNSLHCIVSNTSEEESKEFLNTIMQRAVSVRKHAIFLIANISDTKNFYSMLQTVGEKEQNSTLRKFILKKTFTYFCHNPSEKCFQLFAQNAKLINRKDEEAYEYFLNLKQVPYRYKSKFIEVAWDNINKSELEEIRKRRFELLSNLNDTEISCLSNNFGKDIFCNENINGLHQFYCKYLILSNQEVKLKCFFNLIQNKIENQPNIKFRKFIQSFLKEMCMHCIKNDEKKFLSIFATYWYKIITPTVAFEEHLILQFSLLYLTCPSEEKIKNFAEKTSQFYVETVNKYGNAIVDKFSTILQSNIYNYMSRLDGTCNEHKIQFLVDLMNVNKSPNIYILILISLPLKYSASKELSNKHKMILDEIKACEDSVVQIYYNAYWLQMDISED